MSRPKTMPDGRICTNVRLPKELHAAILQAASDRDVSADWIMTRLLDEGMKRLIPADEIPLTRATPVPPVPETPGEER